MAVDGSRWIPRQARLVFQGISKLSRVSIGGVCASMNVDGENTTGIRLRKLIGNSVPVRTILAVDAGIFLYNHIFVAGSAGNKWCY